MKSRIVVIADTPNLFRSAVQKFGTGVHVDYQGFRRRLLDVGAVRAEAVINGGVSANFTRWLSRVGWVPVLSHAEDADEMVIARAVALHQVSDCVVIASGDGKNVRLVQLLKSAGKIATIAAISGSVHRKLYQVADDVFDFPVLTSKTAIPTAA